MAKRGTNEPDRECCCCGRTVPVIFRDGKNDMILTCDRCLDPVCRHCSDEDTQTGDVTCANCLENDAHATIR